MSPIFFQSQSDFREWLEKNHTTESELIVGYYKVGTGKPSMTWSQSVDQALCFGWIDGVRRSIDSESYCIRFTPRRSKSIWSAINLKKIEELTKQGLMFPAGIAAFEKRTDNKSKIYAYENDHAEFSDEFAKKFQANTKAWDFFMKQAPSYQRVAKYHIMAAKQHVTQLSRLGKLILASEEHRRLF